jgi:hypothetical protein
MKKEIRKRRRKENPRENLIVSHVVIYWDNVG